MGDVGDIGDTIENKGEFCPRYGPLSPVLTGDTLPRGQKKGRQSRPFSPLWW
jgi:hypothetical protein